MKSGTATIELQTKTTWIMPLQNFAENPPKNGRHLIQSNNWIRNKTKNI